MHVSISITREVVEDMVLDGYFLKKGALVQAPSLIAHFDEKAWGVDGHPAAEFWPLRHIIYEDRVDESGRIEKVMKFSTLKQGSKILAFG